MYGVWMVWAVWIAGALALLLWVIMPVRDFQDALRRRLDREAEKTGRPEGKGD
jgi:hypothetical protein